MRSNSTRPNWRRCLNAAVAALLLSSTLSANLRPKGLEQSASPIEERLRKVEAEENRAPREEAIRQYEVLLTEFEALKQPAGMARCKLGLSRLTARQNVPKAVELAQSAVELASLSGDQRLFATANFEVAGRLFSIGNYSSALDHYKSALEGFRKVKDAFQEGRSLNGLGNVYLLTSFYQRAEEHYSQACKLAREIQNDVLRGRCLNNLVELYWRVGKYTEAIDTGEESLPLGPAQPARRGGGTRRIRRVRQGVGDHRNGIRHRRGNDPDRLTQPWISN